MQPSRSHPQLPIVTEFTELMPEEEEQPEQDIERPTLKRHKSTNELDVKKKRRSAANNVVDRLMSIGKLYK